MSQYKRRASDFAEDNSFHPRRIRMLLRRNWKLVSAFPAAAFVLSLFTYLVDVPRFVSMSKIQIQQYSLGKLMSEQQMFSPIDAVDETTRMQNMAAIFDSELFLNNFVAEVKKAPEKEQLTLILTPGLNYSPTYILSRMGLWHFEFPKVDFATVTDEDLGDVLLGMVQTMPMPTDKTIDVKVVAQEPKTAQVVNRAALNAFLKTAQEIDRREADLVVELFREQARATEAHLQQLEAKLSDFIKANPYFASENATGNFFTEYARLKMRKVVLDKQIDSNRTLLGYLKAKWQSRSPDAAAVFSSLEKANRELVEFKYSRLRLRQLQYKDDDASVIELEDKIKSTEAFITQLKSKIKTSDISDTENENFQKEPLERLSKLQDSILKDEAELKGLEQSLAIMDDDARVISEKATVRNYLRREIESFSAVHAEAFKRWHMGKLRSFGDTGAYSVTAQPSLPKGQIGLGFLKRIVFAVLLGFAFAFSVMLVIESLSPKIIERNDLEGSGLLFAGRLNNTAASRAEILASVESLPIEHDDNSKTQIILCASPSKQVDIRFFEPLAHYLADHSKKALMVSVGHTVIPPGYDKVSTSRFAHFFQYPGGNEDLVWVLEDDAFDAVKTVLNRYKSSYHTIFLFVHDAEESNVYPLCQKMADRVLLVGAVGAHTKKDYVRLTRGFERDNAIHVALVWDYDSGTLQQSEKGSQQKIIQKLFKKTFLKVPEKTGETTTPPPESSGTDGQKVA